MHLYYKTLAYRAKLPKKQLTFLWKEKDAMERKKILTYGGWYNNKGQVLVAMWISEFIRLVIYANRRSGRRIVYQSFPEVR